MKLVCPECGAVASAASWANEMEIREVLAAIVKLPPALIGSVLPYLALFRPERRALKWKRARFIIKELAILVDRGMVQVQGKVARPCPPAIWSKAMEEMLGNPKLRRPLKNHNYLREVAWNLADAVDCKAEAARNAKERHGESAGRRPGEAQIDKEDAERVDPQKCIADLKKRNPKFR